jgi:hypothetical protein
MQGVGGHRLHDEYRLDPSNRRNSGGSRLTRPLLRLSARGNDTPGAEPANLEQRVFAAAVRVRDAFESGQSGVYS